MSILIKEYDLTNPARNEYNNFSVVVPGFVKNGYNNKVFDANDIYEVDNQKDFIANVGCVENGDNLPEDTEEIAAIPAVAEALFTKDAGTGEIIPYEIPEGTKVYTKSAEPDATKIGGGYLADEEGYVYTFEFESDGHGKIDDAEYYELTNEGADATEVETVAHLGNQIAFELLGLGYTVLYKKIDNLAELESEDFWEPLKDRAVYDFRYVTTGDYSANNAVKAIIKLAKKLNANDNFGRGDCIALVDLPAETYQGKTLKDALEAMQNKACDYNYGDQALGKYTSYFAPHWNTENLNKRIDGQYTNYTNVNFPAWLYYLACAKQAESSNYDEWFAFAGYNRGANNLYKITSIDYKFGDAAVDVLQKRDTKDAPSINPIITLKGNYYIWGNRTAYQPTSEEDLKASHFLNIRQLCCTLKKQIYMACRELTFEPNNNILWVKFCDKVRPILEKMKANQGIDDYLFVKLVETKKATLKALIRIVPVEAVEDFDISLTLEDSLEGTLVTFGEVDSENN